MMIKGNFTKNNKQAGKVVDRWGEWGRGRERVVQGIRAVRFGSDRLHVRIGLGRTHA